MLKGKIPDQREWDLEGLEERGSQFYATQLVKIAKHYGFEGYLMNFEVKVDMVPELLTWLTFLREELHREIPGAELMWYDSVKHDGNLSW